MSPRLNKSGFTLIEVVFVILLVALMTTYARKDMGNNADAQRFEATKAKMESIRSAILGDPRYIDTEGHRRNFGFYGDMGALPTSLNDLVTQGASPAWVYDSSWGFGSGWRGPYLAAPVSGASPATSDEWKTPFVWSPLANPPTLTSRGADRVAGGTGLNEDIVMTFPANLLLGNVRGMVSDNTTAVASGTVTLAYPAAGSLTTTSVSPTATGYFSFTNIPFGLRGLRVTGVGSLPVQAIVVDKNEINVSMSLANVAGATEKISYNASSARTQSAGTQVFLTFTSTYKVPVQIQTVTASYSGGATVSNIVVNNVSNAVSPAVSSGTAVTVSAVQTAVANTVNSLELDFSASMTGIAITVTLTYSNRTSTDVMVFTP